MPDQRRAAIRKPKPHPLEPATSDAEAVPAATQDRPIRASLRPMKSPKAVTGTSSGRWAQLNVRIPADLEQRLTTAALTLTGQRQERVGKVTVVEEALSEYLDRYKL